MDLAEDYCENYVYGWIKLYRSTQNKGWYKKSEYVHLWIHILMKASHKGKEFWFDGDNIKLGAGQFVTGRKILSIETGINESKVQRILKFFESEQQIEQQTSNTNRLISVLKYEQYQNSEQQIEQRVNNQRTTSEQRVNTINNDNNIKNYKNDGVYADVTVLKDRYLKNERLVNAVISNPKNKITNLSDLETKLNAFTSQLQEKGRFSETYAEYCEYFLYWSRKQENTESVLDDLNKLNY